MRVNRAYYTATIINLLEVGKYNNRLKLWRHYHISVNVQLSKIKT